MKKRMRMLAFTLALILGLSVFAGCRSTMAVENVNREMEEEVEDTPLPKLPSIDWQADTTQKYMFDDEVTSLICIQVTAPHKARVLLFVKEIEYDRRTWTLDFECDAIIGKNGLGKTAPGDGKTPTGEFGITTAFGIKPDPGTPLPYANVTDDVYLCGDDVAFNQIISILDEPHECTGGLHLMDYTPEYNYGLFLDYNFPGTPEHGGGIFLYCRGTQTYTAGGIAIAENDLVYLMCFADRATRVFIDYSDDYQE